MVGKKVIIAEDDDLIVNYSIMMFQDKGYDVKRATNGLEALSLIEGGFMPDLLVTDIGMPNMDGYGLIDELGKRGHEHPVIIVSGQDRIEGYNYHYDGKIEYLQKPISTSDVVKKADEMLG